MCAKTTSRSALNTKMELCLQRSFVIKSCEWTPHDVEKPFMEVAEPTREMDYQWLHIKFLQYHNGSWSLASALQPHCISWKSCKRELLDGYEPSNAGSEILLLNISQMQHHGKDYIDMESFPDLWFLHPKNVLFCSEKKREGHGYVAAWPV